MAFKHFKVALAVLFAVSVLGPSHGKGHKRMDEAAHNTKFCDSVGGNTEVRHDYDFPSGTSYVKVDCETEDKVYEGGLDKESSLDSLQQALFFASLTGKKPVVVIYDTDQKIGRYEHRIKVACESVGVEFLRWSLKR